MMKWLVGLFLLLSQMICFAAPERIGGVELDRSDRYLMPSTSVGDELRIDVILPIGYETSGERYPVVYVTDANYLLVAAATSYLAQATDEFSKMIIVGIGWNVPSITRIRVRDLSPTCDTEFQQQRELKDHECGRADAFVSFIADELQPFIDANYRTSNDDTLVGYSFGGLFALHVLFNHTDTFDRYLIGSASMNWDDRLIFAAEEAYAKQHEDLPKRIYIYAGGLEGGGTIPNTYRMYEQLLAREYPGLDIELEVLDGETHMTSIAPFVIRGLRSVGFAAD